MAWTLLTAHVTILLHSEAYSVNENKENTDSERGRLGHLDCHWVGNGGCCTDCFCVVLYVGATDYLWVEKINAW